MSSPLEHLLDQASVALRNMRADELEALASEAERVAAVCRVLGRSDIALLERSRERFAGLLSSTWNSLDLLEHFHQQEHQQGAGRWVR